MEQRVYELLFVIPAELEDEENQKVLETVEKTVGDRGSIIELKEWKKRRLAYPINRVNEGHYFLIYFNAPGEILPLISRRLNQMEQVLPHTIVRIDEDYRKADLPLPFAAPNAETPAAGAPVEEADNV